MDALVFDETARLVESPVRGIYVLYSELDICFIEKIFLKYEYSFINEIIFVSECVRPERKEVLQAVKRRITTICSPGAGVRVRVKLRGVEKRLLSRGDLESLLVQVSCRPSGRGPYCVVIESFGFGWIAVSVGSMKPWNYDCRVCSPC